MDTIDLLIILAMFVVFCVGWWCGNRYGSAQAMLEAMKKHLSTRLDE